MQLTRAHGDVEGAHRADAWKMVLEHTPGPLDDVVVAAARKAHALWSAYRDGVAERMGLAAVSAATG